MRRLWALLAMLLVAAGCKGSGTSAPSTDPFFGRTRIEPPRTGAVSGNLGPGTNPAQSSTAGSAASGGAIGHSAVGQPGSTVQRSSTGQPTSPAQNWSPPQPKTNSVPAAIPGQQGSGPLPATPGVGSGNSGGFSSPTPSRPLSGRGDQISIPIAARSEPLGQKSATGSGPEPSTMSAAGPGATPLKTETGTTTGGSSSSGSGLSGTPSSASATNQPVRPYLDPGSPSSLEGKERIVREIERTASAPGVAPRYAPYPGSGSGSAGNASAPPASSPGVNIADLPESK